MYIMFTRGSKNGGLRTVGWYLASGTCRPAAYSRVVIMRVIGRPDEIDSMSSEILKL